MPGSNPIWALSAEAAEEAKYSLEVAAAKKMQDEVEQLQSQALAAAPSHLRMM